MRMQMFVPGFICACFSLCAAAYTQGTSSGGSPCYTPPPPKSLSSRQQARIKSLEKDVQRLDAKLDKKRGELNGLRRAPEDRSPQNPFADKSKAQIVQVIGAYYGVNKGRKEGFLSGDRLAIVHRAGTVCIVGFSTIDQLYDHDMMLVPEQDNGVKIEDEVYVINRGDSPRSLVYANLK